ncbi:hypothetical protein LN042_23150 [Kitasatospora sp. RB6PN24]|uniref:hypothetical protein n=1 Tax=Kitasatospora humi TaxID=2893891 RepID=UPI001E404B44|nr:hypothetical protein [Kitasatospora humi]MCC9309934.1 hypothetical protein [Kitasatospora humi]
MAPARWLADTLGPGQGARTALSWAGDPNLLVPVPTGIGWNAVQLAAGTGLPLLDALLRGHAPHRVGPVLYDTRTEQTYWLTTPNAETWWGEPHPQARLLPTGTSIEMPSPTPSTGDGLSAASVRWAHLLAANGTLSSARWLHNILFDQTTGSGRAHPARLPQQWPPPLPGAG